MNASGITPASDYNLKVGEAYFNSSIHAGVGWDSNYDQTPDGKGSGFYSVGVLTDVSWALTPYVRLDTNFNVEYVKYADDVGDDGFRVNGGLDDSKAGASLVVLVDDRTITVSGHVSSSIAGLRVQEDDGSQQNQSFEAFDYVLGVDYSRLLSPNTTAKLGYSFSSSKSIGSSNSDDVSSNLDNTVHRVDSDLSSELNDSLRAGVYSGVSRTLSEGAGRDDATTYSLGGEGQYTAGGGAVITARSGADYIDLSGGGPGSGWSPNVGLSVQFMTRNYFQHTVTTSYRHELSNLVDDSGNSQDVAQVQGTWSLSYGVSMDLTPQLGVVLTQGLSQVEDDGDDGCERRYTFGFGTGYSLGARWSVRLSYQYTNQFDGGPRASEFDRHLIETSISYKL